MSYVSLEEERIKELFKQAMLELFQERKDVFYDLFAEVLEDMALVNAIREGESTETVSREAVFQVLDNQYGKGSVVCSTVNCTTAGSGS